MHEHVTDPYVQQAQRDGYRSRAAYKLLDIDRRDRLLRPGMCVVDLGAAPGSWSQVAVARVGRSGKVVACDLLEMVPVPGCDFVHGDFNDEAVRGAILAALGGRQPDLVLSDLAPNISGIADVDQARIVSLCEAALEFSASVLKPSGRVLVKTFQGADFPELRRQFANRLAAVEIRKPPASRDRSSEVYLLGRRHD
jgi:23S rRNA (uridine2552-2'-O)-methyltransferase